MPDPVDEFAWIASLRSLTLGDERALDLADDAAILPSRPGCDLVISKDAMVEGVHFLVGEAPDIIARRLLRTSLSDLAAKAATPFGYFLLTAWPPGRDEAWRAAFARGLGEDGQAFGVALLGGDTVATSGPLVVSATVLGWVPEGRAVVRSGAQEGDALMVCGDIGDGWLGLQAARATSSDIDSALATRYRLPTPLLVIRTALAEHARAAVDVSDGLIADVSHIAKASGLGFSLDLNLMPVSPGALAWCDRQSGASTARLALAVGGDDYAVAAAVAPTHEMAFAAAVRAEGVSVARVGAFEAAAGARISAGGQPIETVRTGWRHLDPRDPCGRLLRLLFTHWLALPGRFWQFPAASPGASSLSA